MRCAGSYCIDYGIKKGRTLFYVDVVTGEERLRKDLSIIMSSLLFLKRIFTNKLYWMSIIVALLLLLCSIVYTSPESGEKYTFISMFYDDVAKDALDNGMIMLRNVFMGYDASYLWMFCPIIVGIPCIILNRTERFVMFRTGKNKYLFFKYFSSLIASGLIMLLAYIAFVSLCMIISKENMWDELLFKKMLSVFCWGVISALPSLVLSEFVHNKYLILCIPFVLNYFMYMFVGRIIPYDIYTYINPGTFQILFLYENDVVIPTTIIMLALILACALLKKLIMERRCDCGQQ